MRRTIQAWSAVSKGSSFACAVVLGWGRSIFHPLGLLQVPLVLPDAFVSGKAAAPACPAGRTGTFPSSPSCWTRQGCAVSPCALLLAAYPEGLAHSAHQLAMEKLWPHLLLRAGKSALRVLSFPVLLLGRGVHGGRVEVWLYI